MQNVKLTRRTVGMLKAGLTEAGPELVSDPRDDKGKKWGLVPILRFLTAAIAAGKKCLREVEELSMQLSRETRKQLGVFRRVSDSTLRGIVTCLSPLEIAAMIRRVAQAAFRRGAFISDFPLDGAAMDGKSTAIEEVNNEWVQTHKKKKGLAAYGLVRTITITLVTALCRPLLEVVPMGSGGNEMSFFRTAYALLLEHHRAAFDYVTYDAGANCATNAEVVVDSGKHYVFALKDKNRFLLRKAKEVLGHKPPSTAVDFTEDLECKRDNIRTFRYIHIAEVPNGYKAMQSVRTVFRVHAQKVDGNGKVLSEETRYFVSSLLHNRLTAKQWLELVRRHWGVEVTHNILDVAFQEDKRPFLTHSAQGMLVMLMLRRLTYNLLTLWKGRTLRSDENRAAPWKTVFGWVERALEQATKTAWSGLRDRKACPAFA
jgi:hypothetical protein